MLEDTGSQLQQRSFADAELELAWWVGLQDTASMKKGMGQDAPVAYDDGGLVRRSAASLAVAVRRAFRPSRSDLCDDRIERIQLGLSAMASVAVLLITYIMLDRPTAEWAALLVEADHDLYHVAQIVTYIGLAGWMLLVLLVCGLAISVTRWREMARRDMLERIALYANINFAFFAIGVSSSAAWIIKNMIGRARPRFMDDMGLLAFEPVAFLARFASFPSGHSATLGAAAMVLVLLLPRYRNVWLCLALVGGISRVIVQAHYMTDVVAGLALGAGMTLWWSRHLARRNCMFRIDGGWLPYRRHPV